MIISHAGPITTPPARVALSITSMSILRKYTLLKATAKRVLAEMLRNVLTIALCLAYPSLSAALKLGQYMKRKSVPAMETKSDL